ncbi:MAG: hypothetical protein FWH35_00560 [Treponema sp.]|nr:hypothetical protein [Treponema sp.]
MDDFWDDLNMTKEEAALYFTLTEAKIKKIEAKARRRLSMTDEDKALFKVHKMIENDPELRELITTLIMATR